MQSEKGPSLDDYYLPGLLGHPVNPKNRASIEAGEIRTSELLVEGCGKESSQMGFI